MRYDYLLTLFTGHDNEFRPALTRPFTQEEYIIATDAHVMIVIDKDVCKNQYIGAEKTPDALKVFNDIKRTCQELICIDDLFSAESHFDIKYDYMSCKACEGSGVLTCKECGFDHECEECNGKGTIETGETQMRTKISVGTKYIKIGNSYFKPHIVDKLLNAMFILGVNSCIRLSNEVSHGNIFQIDQHCQVLLMPQMEPEGGWDD